MILIIVFNNATGSSELMVDDPVTDLVALGSAALADEAAALSTRWNELHVAGDVALMRRDVAAAHAAFEAALATADELLRALPLAGLDLYALSCQRLAETARELGRADEACELAWRWLDRVLVLVESSQAPIDQRAACLGHLDAPLKQVLADLARHPSSNHRADAGRVPAALDRIRRASASVARAPRRRPAGATPAGVTGERGPSNLHAAMLLH